MPGGRIWRKFELIQAVMHALVTCKNEEDPIKNEGLQEIDVRLSNSASRGARVVTLFIPL